MLLLLALISSAAAAPYYYPYYQHQIPAVYNPYVQLHAPSYTPSSDKTRTIVSAYPIPATRLITWSPLQRASGVFQALPAGDAALAPLATATTVSGSVEFQQDPLTPLFANL